MFQTALSTERIYDRRSTVVTLLSVRLHDNVIYFIYKSV